MINLPTQSKKLGIFLPLLLIVGALVLVNLRVPKEPEAPILSVNQDTDTATILLEEPIKGIYPNSNKDTKSSVFNFNLFDALVNLKNGRIDKGIASAWKNIDPTTWEFIINTSARFSDGSNVSPNDVKFSIETAVNNNWPVSVPITQISSVTINSDTQVTVKTASPLPNLLVLISQIPILSQSQFNKKAETDFLVGTGPFKLTSFDNQKDQSLVKDQTIVLEQNKDYFGTKSRVKKLIYRYINPTSLAQLNAYDLEKSFQIIEPGAISSGLVAQLANAHYSKTLIPQNQVSVLILNPSSSSLKYIHGDTNPFSQKRVRQALSISISTNQVIADATADAHPASQLATPLVFGYNPQIHRLGVNQKQASQLLTEAGYPKGFTFTLTVPENKLAEGKSIARQLESINLDTKVITIDPSSEPIRVGKGDFAAYLGSWENDFYDTTSLFNSALVSGGPENVTHFSDKRIDDKASQLNQTFDSTNREKILNDAMTLAMDDMIWIPIMEKTIPVLVKDNIDLTFSEPFIAGVDISGK